MPRPIKPDRQWSSAEWSDTVRLSDDDKVTLLETLVRPTNHSKKDSRASAIIRDIESILGDYQFYKTTIDDRPRPENFLAELPAFSQACRDAKGKLALTHALRQSKWTQAFKGELKRLQKDLTMAKMGADAAIRELRALLIRDKLTPTDEREWTPTARDRTILSLSMFFAEYYKGKAVNKAERDMAESDFITATMDAASIPMPKHKYKTSHEKAKAVLRIVKRCANRV